MCGKQSEFRDIPTLLILNSQPRHTTSSIFLLLCMWAVKAQAIFRGCAGSSEPSLFAYAIGTIISLAVLFHEIKYVNIIFIKMQNRAAMNSFLGTCICVFAYIIPVMHS